VPTKASRAHEGAPCSNPLPGSTATQLWPCPQSTADAVQASRSGKGGCGDRERDTEMFQTGPLWELTVSFPLPRPFPSPSFSLHHICTKKRMKQGGCCFPGHSHQAGGEVPAPISTQQLTRQKDAQSPQQQLPSAAQRATVPLQVSRGANKGKAEPKSTWPGSSTCRNCAAKRSAVRAADQAALADPAEKRGGMRQSGKWGQRSLPRPVASHTSLKFHRNLLSKSTLFATAINPWDVLHYYHTRRRGNRPSRLAHAQGPPR